MTEKPPIKLIQNLLTNKKFKFLTINYFLNNIFDVKTKKEYDCKMLLDYLKLANEKDKELFMSYESIK